jgi:hypothetical protein
MRLDHHACDVHRSTARGLRQPASGITVVEAPTQIDRTGLHHAWVGELPPELVGYIRGAWQHPARRAR